MCFLNAPFVNLLDYVVHMFIYIITDTMLFPFRRIYPLAEMNEKDS